jgi:hypothetical protein
MKGIVKKEKLYGITYTDDTYGDCTYQYVTIAKNVYIALKEFKKFQRCLNDVEVVKIELLGG